MASDKVIINSAIGKWYPRGQQRLLNSIENCQYDGDVLFYTNEPINEYYKQYNPYTTKASALYEAIKMGYKYILWIDCSIWAIGDIDKFFDNVKGEGYFIKSGYNCAQTTNQHACNVSGYTYDELEKLPELWSCMFGFDMTNEKSKRCAELFLEYSTMGVFDGSREYNPTESSDSRFLFSRQDQTSLSLAYHKCGINNAFEPNYHIVQDINRNEINNNTYFLMRGM